MNLSTELIRVLAPEKVPSRSIFALILDQTAQQIIDFVKCPEEIRFTVRRRFLIQYTVKNA